MKFSLLFVLAFIAFTAEAELTKEQKKRCEEYTSIFENDTIELQYAYVENIHDGRGYTSGRAGFTTGTADALEVIKKYTAKKPGNPLAKFIPELETLAKKSSGDVTHLSGYPAAWKECAKDAVFRQTQDEVSDEMYYR
jgi:chitosanase